MIIPGNAAVIGLLGGGDDGGGGGGDHPVTPQTQFIIGATELDTQKPFVIVVATKWFTQPLPAPDKNLNGVMFQFFNSKSSLGEMVVEGGTDGDLTLSPGDCAVFYCTGGAWILLNAPQETDVGAGAQALFNLSAMTWKNIATGDHCPLNNTLYRNDPNNLIMLGTGTYTTSLGDHCVGRVKLKGGYRYEVSGLVAAEANLSYYGYSLWDVTGNMAILGTRAAGYGKKVELIDTQSVALVAPDYGEDSTLLLPIATQSEALVAPEADMLIELRLTGGSIVGWAAGDNRTAGCWLKVVCLGKA
ncbi:hypothetical protein NOE29_09005 [Escherichia coli]|nr:hypothetical protein [Escherichia coli]MCQ1632896.1 hypothetical protein [Escherichia coli]